MSECAVYHVTKDGTFCERYQANGQPSIVTKVAEPGEKYVEKMLGRTTENSCGCKAETSCSCGTHSVEKMAGAVEKSSTIVNLEDLALREKARDAVFQVSKILRNRGATLTNGAAVTPEKTPYSVEQTRER
jgi:hypothetical protein